MDFGEILVIYQVWEEKYLIAIQRYAILPIKVASRNQKKSLNLKPTFMNRGAFALCCFDS